MTFRLTDTLHLTFNRPTRVEIGLALILLFALMSSVRFLHTAVSAYPSIAEVDEVTRFETRLQLLKHTLPPYGVVGYIADPNPEGVVRDSRYVRRYVLTQYSLSPVIVVDSVEPDLLVGNFDSAARPESVSIPGLMLVKDFGDGVMLFSKKAR